MAKYNIKDSQHYVKAIIADVSKIESDITLSQIWDIFTKRSNEFLSTEMDYLVLEANNNKINFLNLNNLDKSPTLFQKNMLKYFAFALSPTLIKLEFKEDYSHNHFGDFHSLITDSNRITLKNINNLNELIKEVSLDDDFKEKIAKKLNVKKEKCEDFLSDVFLNIHAEYKLREMQSWLPEVLSPVNELDQTPFIYNPNKYDVFGVEVDDEVEYETDDDYEVSFALTPYTPKTKQQNKSAKPTQDSSEKIKIEDLISHQQKIVNRLYDNLNEVREYFSKKEKLGEKSDSGYLLGQDNMTSSMRMIGLQMTRATLSTQNAIIYSHHGWKGKKQRQKLTHFYIKLIDDLNKDSESSAYLKITSQDSKQNQASKQHNDSALLSLHHRLKEVLVSSDVCTPLEQKLFTSIHSLVVKNNQTTQERAQKEALRLLLSSNWTGAIYFKALSPQNKDYNWGNYFFDINEENLKSNDAKKLLKLYIKTIGQETGSYLNKIISKLDTQEKSTLLKSFLKSNDYQAIDFIATVMPKNEVIKAYSSFIGEQMTKTPALKSIWEGEMIKESIENDINVESKKPNKKLKI